MARHFSGSAPNTDVITLPSVSGLKPTGAQSIACWGYFTDITNRSDFFNCWGGGAGTQGYLLTLLGGPPNTLRYYLSSTGGNASGADSTITPTQNVWTHVCGTWDGTNQRIYVDGGAPHSATPGYGSIYASGNPPRIGHSPDAVQQRDITIAECVLYNVALTANEVIALAKGRRPPMIRPANILGYWPLDGLQSPEPDLSGNGNNGTVTGTTLANGPPISTFTRRWPVHSEIVQTFSPAWAQGINQPVLGTGTY